MSAHRHERRRRARRARLAEQRDQPYREVRRVVDFVAEYVPPAERDRFFRHALHGVLVEEAKETLVFVRGRADERDLTGYRTAFAWLCVELLAPAVDAKLMSETAAARAAHWAVRCAEVALCELPIGRAAA